MKHIITAIVFSMGIMASAADLYWTGAQSGVWDTTTLNWTNSMGQAVAFAENDNVHFLDGVTQTEITVGGSLPKIGTIVCFQ